MQVFIAIQFEILNDKLDELENNMKEFVALVEWNRVMPLWMTTKAVF